MLRIKKEIDLKELEKFGFEHIPKQNGIYEHYEYATKMEEDFYPMLRCYIYCNDRRIGVNTNEIDILYDLIQAGYVEKVEE